jgi:hypothetical protein
MANGDRCRYRNGPGAGLASTGTAPSSCPVSDAPNAASREPDEGSALVKPQPAALDSPIQTGLVFGWRGFLAEQAC